MGNYIYVGQSNLRIWVSTGADITGQTLATIEVRKPTGSQTSWTATVDNASTGGIYYDLLSVGALDIKRDWRLQAKIVYSDDSTSYGKTTVMKVFGLFD